VFKFRKKLSPRLSLACCLGEQNYSLSTLKNNKQILSNVFREFPEKDSPLFSKALTEDVKNFKLIGTTCRLILSHELYQLILMDTLNVPKNERRKAFRWRLEGMIDYPLNDIAVDAFLLPPQGVNINKAYVAATRLSSLKASLEKFKSAFLKVTEITIPELVLKNLIVQIFPEEEGPILLVILRGGNYQILGIYQNQLCMIRDLATLSMVSSQASDIDMLTLEIQRSIDYFISEVLISKSAKLVFAPGFTYTEEFQNTLELGLDRKITFIDLNDHFELASPLSINEQINTLYSICGAIIPPFSESEEL
jgi:MSHA biogenesis protein MshI